MHGMSGSVLIATSEAREACKGEADLTERIKKAMRACHGHWMETNEGEQFRAAVAAAMMESPEHEKDRIARSANALNRIGAMLQALQAGVPVDVEAMAAEKPDDDILPLRGLWSDTAPDKRS